MKGRQRVSMSVAMVGIVALAVTDTLGLTAQVQAKTHNIEFTAMETEIVVEGTGKKYKAWTFNGQMPGPVVRVTEGDPVNFTLENPKTNAYGHSMDFHAAEIDFLKNYREIRPGETIQYTFVANKPGVFFYHCGAPPMVQHIARGMFGAIIVDPKNANAWPKADREYVLVQSEFWKNPDNVQAMFDRKFDHVVFNGGIWKDHPFFMGGAPLEAKANEREIWDNVYESGNPANNLKGVQTYVVGPGSAATFDLVSESPGVYPIITHSLTAALRGAIAALVITPVAQNAPLMPLTPWNP